MASRTLRRVLSEIRKTSSEKKLADSLLTRHIFDQYRKHQVTDELHCKEQEEMKFLADTYACYLRSTRRYNEIKQHYHGKGERSVAETANMVGFKLPHDPK